MTSLPAAPLAAHATPAASAGPWRGTTIRQDFVREFRSAGGAGESLGRHRNQRTPGLSRSAGAHPQRCAGRRLFALGARRLRGHRARSAQRAHARRAGVRPGPGARGFDYGSQVFQGRAHVVAVREGDLAALFIAAAARAEFVQRLPTLLQILDSLRFAPGPGRQFHERLRQCRLPWDLVPRIRCEPRAALAQAGPKRSPRVAARWRGQPGAQDSARSSSEKLLAIGSRRWQRRAAFRLRA